MKLTIGVPVYNPGKYFLLAMGTILDQSFKDFEVLLVDDGSTDNSGKFCDDFAEKYPFIRVIHKPNGGPSSARNVIIREARGEYVGIIDADDMIHPDYYKRMVSVLDETGLPVVKCGREYLEKGALPENKPIGKGYEIITTKRAFKNDLCELRRTLLVEGMCTKLWRREVLQQGSFNEELRNEEDILFVFEMLFKFDKFAKIDDTLYYVVQNENSITHNSQNCERNLIHIIRSREIMAERVKDLAPESLNVIVNNSLFNIFEEYKYWLSKGVQIPQSVRDAIIKTFAPYENILNFMIKKQFEGLKRGENKVIEFYHKKTLRSIYKRFMRYETYRSKH
ncbi:MAG: glycosyltransferase [Abditibacteriota bacterium]|nr:glycosyltransferase [Abditibacteriota bacterium]